MRTQYVYRDIAGLTTVLVVLLGFGMLLSVVGLLSSFLQLELLDRPQFTEAEGEANDFRETVVGWVTLVFHLVTVVFFCKWIVRANKNVRALGAVDLPITPGWAVGYFFVPFLNLVRPYQAMRDMAKASNDPAEWRAAAAGPVLPIWWTLWLVSGFVGQTAFRLNLHAKDVEGFRVATFAEIAAAVMEIPLGVVAILLVSQIAAAQIRQARDAPRLADAFDPDDEPESWRS